MRKFEEMGLKEWGKVSWKCSLAHVELELNQVNLKDFQKLLMFGIPDPPYSFVMCIVLWVVMFIIIYIIMYIVMWVSMYNLIFLSAGQKSCLGRLEGKWENNLFWSQSKLNIILIFLGAGELNK